MTWTDERVERLKSMWAEGRSAYEIALHLRGTTRNAVIGKAHRLGLTGRATVVRKKNLRVGVLRYWKSAPIERKKAQKKVLDEGRETQRQQRIAALLADPMPITPDATLPTVSTADLEPHHCRAPVGGDPRHVRSDQPYYCGAQKVPGLSYCTTHARRYLVNPEAKPASFPKDGHVKPTFSARPVFARGRGLQTV